MVNSNNSGHSLHMTARRAIVYFDKLFHDLSESGVSIVGEFDVRSGDGITSDSALCGDGSVVVGMSALQFNGANWFGYRGLDDQIFVKTLVAVCHELRHSDVFARIRDGVSCPSGVLVSHLARQGSNSYYDFNRYCMAHEIDAEFQGVMGAYRRLIPLCGNEDAERLVCDYVNGQCENNSYYIEQKRVDGRVVRFSSIDEVSEAFFDAYELATDLQPVIRDEMSIPLVSKKYKQIRTAWSKDESLAPLIDGNVIRIGCKPVFDVMWDAGNGDKDRMLASLALRFVPELRQFYGDAVCDSLSVENVFGHDLVSVLDERALAVGVDDVSITDGAKEPPVFSSRDDGLYTDVDGFALR